MKQIITYTGKQVNKFLIEYPTTNDRVNKDTQKGVNFTETDLQLSDGRFIGIVEYFNKTSIQLNNWIKIEPKFNITPITELIANTLLQQLGNITINNFIIYDKRIKHKIIL